MLLTSIISQWYSHYIPIDEVFPSNHSTHVGYISHVISPWNISIKYRWPTVGLNPPIKNHQTTARQWPFQEPKLEVPTIYKAYARYSTSILGSWNSPLSGKALLQSPMEFLIFQGGNAPKTCLLWAPEGRPSGRAGWTGDALNDLENPYYPLA